MLNASSGSAVGTCARITPPRSLSSSSAAGTRLKFAAIGVIKVPQKPASIPIAAIGMLAGFCGTLMTPMAANFNLVPAALLELKDRNGVIRAQVPTALPLLVFNIVLLWWIVA